MTSEKMDKIDRLLAVELMGWVWNEEHHMWVLDSERDTDGKLTFCAPDVLAYGEDKDKQEPWSPTRNIAQAFQVVEAMRKRGFITILTCYPDYQDELPYEVEIQNDELSLITLESDTPELAICLAALAALDIKL